MSKPQRTTSMPSRNSVLAAVANERRRRALGLLLGRTTPVPVRELATHLVADERGDALVAVTAEAARAARVDLVHVHLPKLAEVDLVDWDRDAATVTTSGHPAFQDPEFEALLETDAEGWDAVVASLADRHRRAVLAVLGDRDAPMGTESLARAVQAHAGVGDDDALETLRVALHHVHLPKLADAGLVSHDAEAGTVAYEGHPALAESWLTDDPGATPRTVPANAHRSEDIWTLAGRDAVVERGRALFDSADEELFLMLTTDGLLDATCFDRLAAAVDRGVDVYLGTRTPALRDLVREELPAVTLWEPQLDWLNLAPDQDRVGRLVLADREAIMVGTLGERRDDAGYAETAITGTGEHNALVTMGRELLGSRLDHLDAQSDDFLSQIAP